MTGSILQFAKDFEKLKSDFASTKQADLQILLLISFWPKFEDKITDPKFEPYKDEYISMLTMAVSESNLHDLKIADHIELYNIINQLFQIGCDLYGIEKKAAINLAQKYFVSGEMQRGIELCNRFIEKPVEIDSPDDNLSEFDSFKEICEKARAANQELYNILFPILVEWKAIKEPVKFDGANCLFVEKD